MNRPLDLGIVTDEVSRDLAEALEAARSWGLSLFELREGRERRFPYFAEDEIGIIDELMRSGGRITAVSPGIFKGSVADRQHVRRELNEVLPRSVEMARRFECSTVIVFGFERTAGDESDRLLVLDALTEAADVAAEANLTLAVENEPNYWVDRPAASAELLREIAHPALRLNWDPANLHWGGSLPVYEDFLTMQRYITNLHVKDFQPDDPATPWHPVGAGATPWNQILRWIINETDLGHVTIETHCTPLMESSRMSLDHLRSIMSQ